MALSTNLEISFEQSMPVGNDNITLMTPETPESFHPLSLGQQALWFLYQMAPESVAYNVCNTALICQTIDINFLNRAWQKVVHRHPILRTTYTAYKGKPFQIINEQLECYLQVRDASNWSEEYLKEQISLEIDHTFNLEEDPVARLNLFTRSAQKHILLLTGHHIAGDLWSSDQIFNELRLWYAAETEQVSLEQIEDSLPKNTPYTQFVHWQSEMLSGPKGEKLWEYWQKQLSGELPIVNLPTDRPRPPVQSYRGETHIFRLNEELIRGLGEVARATGTTLYKLMLAAYFALLYRYTDQEDILVGTPMLGRPGREFKGVVGYFVNSVVLRASLSGNLTFKDLLAQLSSTVKEAQRHQDYPFSLLVEKLQPQRDPSRSPLFQVSFTWQKQRWCQSGKELGFKMEPYPLGHQPGASFDLDLMVMEIGEVIQVCWQYNTDLFDGATIARMAGHFQTLLEGIVANPDRRLSELPLLTATERHQLLVEWNDTKTEYPSDKCVHQLFEAQVERSPDAVAVVFEGEKLTYQELNARANQLARYLQGLGVQPEQLVGLYVERSLNTIVGLLGILKAGGAYLPLDPGYPAERLAYMLEDAKVSVLLTQQSFKESLLEHKAQVVCLDTDWPVILQKSQTNPISGIKPDNLAYGIYTSGSTGRPKGVLIEHQAIALHCQNIIDRYQLTSDDRVLQFASVGFDVSLEQIFPTLIVGATLILSETRYLTGSNFHKKLFQLGLTVVNLPPVFWTQWLQFLEENSSATFLKELRLVISGGEAMPPESLKLWQKIPLRTVRLLNAYGPTETTITAMTYEVPQNISLSKIPIGRPLKNRQAYILSYQQQLVPIGIPGELHIGGAGVARGYLNRPELTEEKFIPNPFSDELGARLYKTGDIARYLPDGNIEYLGRTDNQVKIRGFRIELGEIESLLAQHPDVDSAVFVAREDTPGNKQLVAYIVSNLIPDRIPYQSECQLELDGNAIKLHTADISTGGVGVVGVPAIDEGRSVRLHVQLLEESFPRWLCGTVVWSRPPHAGVRFHLTPNEQALVDQTVSYLLEIQGLWKTLQRTVTRNLRDYLKQKLPEYMIPNAFVLMKALPLTTNGKVDRRSLRTPDTSHITPEITFVAPRSNLEMQLVKIWETVLNVYPLGVRDCFFERGGHSLLAVCLMTQIQQQFGKYLPLASLFQNSTIEHQASLLLQQTDFQPSSPLVAIQTAGSQPPFFCVHPVGGNVLCYFDLARHLGKEQPFYGLQSPGLNGEQEPKTSIEDMAAHYIEALQAIQPSGPYYLGGWSLGGIVAFEMAQQLHFRGEEVAFLALIDSYTPAAINWYEEMNEASLLVHLARDMGGLFGKELPLSVDELQQFPPEEQLNYILERAKTLNILPPEVSLEQMHHLMRVFQANREAMLSYIPQPYPGKIALLSASEKPLQVKLDPTQGWDELATHGLLDIQPIPGDHYAILRAPHVQLLAQQLATNFKAEN